MESSGKERWHDDSTTRVTSCAYATGAVGSGNHSRPSSMTYPDGESVSFTYGAANTSSDLVSRLTSLGPSGDKVA